VHCVTNREVPGTYETVRQNGGVQVDVLGPLRVRADDQEIDLGGPRNRALVARLALDAGRPVAATTLIDDLWGLDVPADATNALQSIVSRARRRLPAGALESTPAGYVLQCTSVDAVEFERLVAASRVDEALELWRGEAFADVVEFPFAPSAAHRLGELRLVAVESSLQDRVRSGDDLAVVAQLAELTTAHPYRDGFWALYLTALATHGRANEALTAYDRLRGMLAEELGADPSPELQDLHLSILRGEHSSRRSHPALPSALTSFVGREGAIDDLQAALVDHRLVTILGPGGAGKTRLAVETARTALDRFEDVWLTELAPVTGSDGILQAILSAMGLLEVSVLERPASAPRPDERTRLLEAVHDVEGLLLLDNCEHLIGAVAEIAEDVLAHAPKLRILATSREPLRIIGEFGYQLSPLTMPDADSSIDDAMTHSAVQLFVLRAQAVDQSFVLTAETLPAVREICVRLDGQPLAIELAAARLRTLTAAQVAARLSDRFRLLTGGSRTALPRHRTLRAVVEWSWDLLDDAERDIAERLAVFPGGVTVESAAAVSPAGDATEELLESLADKSLLVSVRGETTRFRMLETLREYGVERLIERGDAEAVRDAHLRHFLDVAEIEGPRLRGGDQVAAIRVVDLERANIMAALRFAIDRGDRADAARMVTALAWFWSIRSQHVEACTWADAVLALPGEGDPASEICIEALALTGILVMRNHLESDQPVPWQGPVDRILALWDAHHPEHQVVDVVLATMAFFHVIGDRDLASQSDPWTRAMINLMQLVLLDNEGRVGEIDDLLEPTIDAFRELGDRWGLAMALSQQGMVQSLDAKYEEALASWEEAIPLLHELGAAEDAEFSEMQVMGLRVAIAEGGGLDELRQELIALLADARRNSNRRFELITQMSLGHVEHVAGHDEAAIEHFDQVLRGLDSVSSFGGGQMEAVIRAGLAVARASSGDLDGARAELTDASSVAVRTRDMPVVSQVASALAVLAHLDGDDERAARVLGASEAIRGRADRMNSDVRQLIDGLRTSLGVARFEELHAEGRSLGRDEAIALAVPEGAVS
jgi:predicted ATPase/DNA-binding SARP family transcriptional activator